MIISFDSNIGGGKSTQLNYFLENNQYTVWLEELNKWMEEKWLDHFYSDMNKFSFGFQMRVFYSQIEKYQKNYLPILNLHSQQPIILSERSPFTCHKIFGEMLVRDGLMSELELDLSNKYNELVGWKPDYGIYIQTSPEICYERIHHRNRNSEKTVPFSYIQDLHDEHERKLLQQEEFPIFVINGNNSVEEIHQEIQETLTKLIRQ
jgi:deoxyadenosine/deoxycytidine kinase